MEAHTDIPRIPMQVTSGCLVASIQVDLTAGLLRQFQHDLLEKIRSSGVTGVILDVSGVQIMDLDDFEQLRRSMAMASIMGARPMLVGLRPGIVAALIELDGDVDGVEAAADLDDALQRLRAAAGEDGAAAGDLGTSASDGTVTWDGEDPDDDRDDPDRDQQ